MTLITEERAPSAQEYCALRIKAGLSAKSLKAAGKFYSYISRLTVLNLHVMTEYQR